MTRTYPTLIFLILLPGLLLAQDSRTVAGARVVVRKSSSIQDRQAAIKRFNNHPVNRYYDRLIVAYEERMQANVKKYKAMARHMKKPQYADPSYFGHKRKPKKRPVGKRKYCTECGIVH